MPLLCGRSGCPVSSWTSEAVVLLPNEKSQPKSKHSMLPVLVVLFLVAWGLMALLVVEQGRTIDAQRALIRSLFSDSTELSQLKGKNFQKQRAEAQAQAEAKSHSQVQTPSSQDKSQAKSAGKFRKPLPERPPTSASDRSDDRRTALRI